MPRPSILNLEYALEVEQFVQQLDQLRAEGSTWQLIAAELQMSERSLHY